MTRNIYLIRHGHREDFIGDSEDYNYEWAETAKNRFDPALSTLGRLQAQKLAATIKGLHVDHLFSSPFLRTIQTAFVLAQQWGLLVKIENGLSEWLNPNWFPSPVQHIDIKQFNSMFPDIIDTSYNSMINPQYPEPDEKDHVWPRVADTINSLLASFEGNLALVGHAASIIGAVFYLAGEILEVNTSLCSLIHFRMQDNAWHLINDGSNLVI